MQDSTKTILRLESTCSMMTGSMSASITSSVPSCYFGRYSFADFRRYAPPAFGDLAGGIGLLDGFPGRAPARNQSLALGFNYLLTDTLLADFRFGFSRYHVNDFNSSYGTTPAKDA